MCSSDDVTESLPPSGAAPTTSLAGELRVVLGKLGRRMRGQGHSEDLTSAQKSVLIRLEREGPATVSTLARLESIRPQSLGATVDALKAAGLVVGTPDPNDGRQTLLSLTPACVELIHATRAAKEDWLDRAIHSSLSPDEQNALPRVIALLQRLADS
jgi:DNA-binding MarR family transcriptional regulator